MGLKNKITIFFLILFISAINTFAEVIRQFDHDKLEKYRSLDKYDYDQAVTKYEPSWFLNFLGALGKFLAQGIGSIFIAVAAIALIGLILYLIFKSGLGSTISNKNYTNEIELNDVEDIEHLDLDLLLAEALANKDYRSATRIMYLQVLQGLNKKKLIDWQIEKTNDDYIKEIKDPRLKNKVDNVTYLYEYVWYGEAELNTLTFEQIEPQFNSLIKEHY